MAATSSQAMPMLTVPEKKPYSVDLHKFLRDHISANFSSHDASASERELSLVRQMRSDLEKQQNSSPASRLDLLLRYYRATSVIEIRLGPVNSIPFTWYDAFRSNKKSSLKSIDFEKAALLFNIGAVHSQIGSMAERDTVEGRKISYAEFQKAACVFRLLKENSVAGATVDLTVECAGMLETLMLAQAQECMFDKVIADSKGVTLCSKVAKQVGLHLKFFSFLC
jgi:programmed cell death 6-interacting protein